MLLPSVLSILILTVSSSPLLQSEEEYQEHVAVERQFDLLDDTLLSDTDAEYLDADVDSRLLTSGTAGLIAPKGISYKTAGDYTLVSIPWGQGTALSFNDTAASTLSTLGNAALLVGGLYLLSGFQGSALADPFGISRRFGQPALPGPHPPRNQRIQHKTGKQVKGKVSKRKSQKVKKPKRRPVDRRGPAMAKPTTQQSAEERQLLRPVRLPSLPTFRPVRPLNFRMPELPALRMPKLPTFRRPSFPQLNNPFRRPAARPRPRPIQQSSRPVSAPAPAPAQTAPAPESAPSSAPLAPSFRPSVQNTPAITSSDPAPNSQAQNIQSQSAPLTLPNPGRPAPSSFGSSFDDDPFSEFQSADFGSDASFRELISAQFGESFDLQRLPNSRSDKKQGGA